MMKSIKNNEIRNREFGEDTGCDGGYSESVSYVNIEEIKFYGEMYHCGGDDYGDLCGDVTSFADDVKSLIPKLNELLQQVGGRPACLQASLNRVQMIVNRGEK